MNQQVYKKVGRKYIPISYSDGFTGFPLEGLWVVYRKPGQKTESCIAQVGQFQNIDYSKLASLIKDKQDVVCKILMQSGKSISELSNEILVEICKNHLNDK